MTRKDTIIVAVLINAGLLIVLFATALKSDSSKEEFAASPAPVVQTAVPDYSFKKETTTVVGDEVDVALNQFAQNAMPSSTPVTQTPSLTPPTDTMATWAPASFADDLKAIALPETTVPTPIQNQNAQTLVAPMAPQNKPAPEFTEIKVKKGDVLEKIARHHHTTVAEIMKTNKLTTSNLRIGQVLKIPHKSIKKAEPSTIAFSPQSSAPEAKYYIVKKGDSPWTIAVRNHLKVEDLLKLNHMSEEQARRLKPGDKLRIQ